MIKAVIFDCFGVLTTDGWLPFAQKHFGHDAALLQSAKDLNRQCDARLLDYPEFIITIAEMAHMTAAEARTQIEDNVANQPIFDYIVGLKPRYKIGMLSNAGRNWLNDLFEPQQVALFDQVVLSCDVGTTKPDPRMYEIICEKLGVDAAETVFIDDSAGYIAAARETGMQGIVYKDFDQFKLDLNLLLNL